MATLNNKLYAISGHTTSIEFFDASNPAAGWQLYSQASLAAQRPASSCVTIGAKGFLFFLCNWVPTDPFVNSIGCWHLADGLWVILQVAMCVNLLAACW